MYTCTVIDLLCVYFRFTRVYTHHLAVVSPTSVGFTPVVVPHGNLKSNKLFYLTLPSTRVLMVTKSQSCGSKEIVSAVSAKVGDILNTCSASQLPRNKCQVSYIRSQTKPYASSSDSDEMFQMIQQAKVGHSTGMFSLRDQDITRTCTCFSLRLSA